MDDGSPLQLTTSRLPFRKGTSRGLQEAGNARVKEDSSSRQYFRPLSSQQDARIKIGIVVQFPVSSSSERMHFGRPNEVFCHIRRPFWLLKHLSTSAGGKDAKLWGQCIQREGASARSPNHSP
jgi:hypothetical protein